MPFMKTTSTRRQFIKKAAAGAGAAAAGTFDLPLHAAEKAFASHAEPIPPHRGIDLPGLHAYASSQSVFAGGKFQFFTSSTVPFQLSIHRLGHDIDSPSADERMAIFPASPARPQPIHPGSYAHVARGLRGSARALTLSCWFRTWKPSAIQGLITQSDGPDSPGFGIRINSSGELEFNLGPENLNASERVHGAAQLSRRQWHHVAAVWDGSEKSLWLDGRKVGSWFVKGPVQLGKSALRLGASGGPGSFGRMQARDFLEGDLALPAIHDRALTPAEIKAGFENRGLVPPPDSGLIACWPLNEEQGDRLQDISRFKRHARIINHATWMVGGPSFDAEQIARYSEYSPATDPRRGHAIRFASDDLYDCRWKQTHEWSPPKQARPGIYVARYHHEIGGKAQDYHVTFIVRRAPSRPKPPILVLCSSNTWLAYNSAAFSANMPPGYFLDTGGYKNSHPEAPFYSCYRDHAAGLPTYQLGLRTPWPCAGPYVLYSSRETGYSHLMRTERFLHVWLEQQGYNFDVVADIDLHRDPGMLRHYQTVILNGHSEYWSINALEGLDQYLTAGGTAIVLSGNTMFWRVSFNEQGSIMECRKFDERIGGRKLASIGELFHSHDGKRGSLLRECGYPAWKYVGLECAGWGDVETKSTGIYHTAAPDHFLFHKPERVGLAAGQTFGHSPSGTSHRAVGHEYDVRVSTLSRMTKTIPPGGRLPEEPAGIVTLATGKRPSNAALDYFTQPTTAPDNIVAELIYWERPQGGRVFHSGAIGTGWSLSADPKLQALMRNVLAHFGIPKPR